MAKCIYGTIQLFLHCCKTRFQQHEVHMNGLRVWRSTCLHIVLQLVLELKGLDSLTTRSSGQSFIAMKIAENLR